MKGNINVLCLSIFIFPFCFCYIRLAFFLSYGCFFSGATTASQYLVNISSKVSLSSPLTFWILSFSLTISSSMSSMRWFSFVMFISPYSMRDSAPFSRLTKWRIWGERGLIVCGRGHQNGMACFVSYPSILFSRRIDGGTYIYFR